MYVQQAAPICQKLLKHSNVTLLENTNRTVVDSRRLEIDDWWRKTLFHWLQCSNYWFEPKSPAWRRIISHYHRPKMPTFRCFWSIRFSWNDQIVVSNALACEYWCDSSEIPAQCSDDRHWWKLSWTRLHSGSFQLDLKPQVKINLCASS